MKKVVINKKKVAALVAAGMLAFTLAACGGNRDTSPDPTPPNNPGIEQPNNGSNEQNNTVEAFDPSSVSIVSIPSIEVPLVEHLTQAEAHIERFNAIGLEYNETFNSTYFVDGLGANVALFIINDLEINLEMGNAIISDNFSHTHNMARADFALNGELSPGWIELLVLPEAKEAFKQILKVIEDAKESRDNTHVHRLLDEALTIEGQNEFTNLCAAVLIGYLRARGNEQEQERAIEAIESIQSFYAANSNLSR